MSSDQMFRAAVRTRPGSRPFAGLRHGAGRVLGVAVRPGLSPSTPQVFGVLLEGGMGGMGGAVHVGSFALTCLDADRPSQVLELAGRFEEWLESAGVSSAAVKTSAILPRAGRRDAASQRAQIEGAVTLVLGRIGVTSIAVGNGDDLASLAGVPRTALQSMALELKAQWRDAGYAALAMSAAAARDTTSRSSTAVR